MFLTNHLGFGPTTIARIYKDRWQIELLFKALTQNLRVKTFVGTSAHALHIQIWTALIALLILKYLQLKATFGWSLSNLVALLRMNLFAYRDLWTWRNDPLTAPPLPPEPVQGELALGSFGQHRLRCRLETHGSRMNLRGIPAQTLYDPVQFGQQ